MNLKKHNFRMARRKAKDTEALGKTKISTLLKEYAVPAIIAMAASSLYNVVDSIFIGNGVGKFALTALGVSFPLMNLMTALGMLVGVGGATILSLLLGQNNRKGAEEVLGNVVSLNLIIGAAFSLLCYIFLDPILIAFGATENTLSYAHEYMAIILIGNVFNHVFYGLNSCLRSIGHPATAMVLTLLTEIINIVLDPLFIFVFDMGVAGAAWATVIAEGIGLIIIMWLFCRPRMEVNFTRGIFRLNWYFAKESLKIGVSPFLMNAVACLVNISINHQMLKYVGDIGIGAYSIIHRISFLFLMVVMGLMQGMQPIAGYNFGARKYSRVKEVYFLTVKWAVGITTAGFLCSEFLPSLLCRAFTSESDLLELSVKGLKYMNIFFPVVGFQIATTQLFQSIGMVNKSVFLSLSRQLIFLIPMLYIFPLKWKETGLWLSFPGSDIASATMALIMMLFLLKDLRKLKDGDDPSSIGGKTYEKL